jgi:hypothetical protein
MRASLISIAGLTASLMLAVSAPALAQTAADTLKNVTTKGTVMTGTIQSMDVTYITDYAADGTYRTSIEGMDRIMTGKWRIEGDKLCTRGDGNPADMCTAYPAGKKPGDTFDVQHPALGAAKVTIRQ